MTGVIQPTKGRHSLWTTWQVYFYLSDRMEKCNLELEQKLVKRTKISSYYSDSGPLRRELYPKHTELILRQAVAVRLTASSSSKLVPAVNTVEAGIYTVWRLMSSGKLKVFRSLGNWLSEFRLYQPDKDGKILKQNDHLMDCTRYFAMSARERMSIKPEPDYDQPRQTYSPGERNFAWMN